jgi:hypothetical protein
MALCSQNVGHVVTRSGKREAVPLVICTVARLYWVDQKIEKTHEWFERPVSAGPELGNTLGLVA